MTLAAGIGSAAVIVGLLASWHAGTAAGASIAVVAVASYPLSAVLRALTRIRTTRATSNPDPLPVSR